jgi:hypothetical protein
MAHGISAYVLVAGIVIAQAGGADPVTAPPASQSALASTASAPSNTAAPPTTPASSPSTTPPTNAAPAPAKAATIDENSEPYVDGYSDGCASANLRYARQAHVKPNRDPKLYDSDVNYHQGWDHGYRKCEDTVSPGALPIMGNSIIL